MVSSLPRDDGPDIKAINDTDHYGDLMAEFNRSTRPDQLNAAARNEKVQQARNVLRDISNKAKAKTNNKQQREDRREVLALTQQNIEAENQELLHDLVAKYRPATSRKRSRSPSLEKECESSNVDDNASCKKKHCSEECSKLQEENCELREELLGLQTLLEEKESTARNQTQISLDDYSKNTQLLQKICAEFGSQLQDLKEVKTSLLLESQKDATERFHLSQQKQHTEGCVEQMETQQSDSDFRSNNDVAEKDAAVEFELTVIESANKVLIEKFGECEETQNDAQNTFFEEVPEEEDENSQNENINLVTTNIEEVSSIGSTTLVDADVSSQALGSRGSSSASVVTSTPRRPRKRPRVAPSIANAFMYDKLHGKKLNQLRYKTRKDVIEKGESVHELRNGIFIPQVARICAERSARSPPMFCKAILRSVLSDDALKWCTMDGKEKGGRKGNGALPAVHEDIKDALWAEMDVVFKNVEARYLDNERSIQNYGVNLKPMEDDEGNVIPEKKYTIWKEKRNRNYLKNECGKIFTDNRKLFGILTESQIAVASAAASDLAPNQAQTPSITSN